MENVILAFRLLRQRRITGPQLRDCLAELESSAAADLSEVLIAKGYLSPDERGNFQSSLKSSAADDDRSVSFLLVSEILQLIEAGAEAGETFLIDGPSTTVSSRQGQRLLRLLIAYRDRSITQRELESLLSDPEQPIPRDIAERLDSEEIRDAVAAASAQAAENDEKLFAQLIGDIVNSRGCSDETPTGTLLNDRFDVGPRFARGGMGDLFVADDRHLGAKVAVKQPRADRRGSAVSAGTRLRREAQITAQVAHQGIPPVYAIGTPSDPYYAMKLVEGEEFGKLIKKYHERLGQPGTRGRTESLAPSSAAETSEVPEKPRSLADLVTYLVSVCNTIHRVHQAKFLHLDLKPSNIRVNAEFGEVFVLDFGLAERRDTVAEGIAISTDDDDIDPMEDSDGFKRQPADRHVAGTFEYMSKPQAEGLRDYHCDVFGLGAILYQILTGVAPIKIPKNRTSIEERIAFVSSINIEPPLKKCPSVPPALNAICVCALHDDWQSVRYQSAEELKDDLDRWLRGEKVAAWDKLGIAEPYADRLVRTVVRHRNKIATVLTVATMLAVMLGGFAWISRQQAVREAYWSSFTNEAYTSLFNYLAPEAPATQIASLDLVAGGKQQELDQMLERYRKFAEDRSSEGAKPLDLARARFVVGRIEQLGGEHDEAIKQLEMAVGHYREHMASDQHKVDDIRRELATAIVAQARSYAANSEVEQADKLYREGLKLREQLVAKHGDLRRDDSKVEDDAIQDIVLLGNVHMNLACLHLMAINTPTLDPSNARQMIKQKVLLQFDETKTVLCKIPEVEAWCNRVTLPKEDGLQQELPSSAEAMRAWARFRFNFSVAQAAISRFMESGQGDDMMASADDAIETVAHLRTLPGRMPEDAYLDCLCLYRSSMLWLDKPWDGSLTDVDPAIRDEAEKLERIRESLDYIDYQLEGLLKAFEHERIQLLQLAARSASLGLWTMTADSLKDRIDAFHQLQDRVVTPMQNRLSAWAPKSKAPGKGNPSEETKASERESRKAWYDELKNAHLRRAEAAVRLLRDAENHPEIDFRAEGLRALAEAERIAREHSLEIPAEIEDLRATLDPSHPPSTEIL